MREPQPRPQLLTLVISCATPSKCPLPHASPGACQHPKLLHLLNRSFQHPALSHSLSISPARSFGKPQYTHSLNRREIRSSLLSPYPSAYSVFTSPFNHFTFLIRHLKHLLANKYPKLHCSLSFRYTLLTKG